MAVYYGYTPETTARPDYGLVLIPGVTFMEEFSLVRPGYIPANGIIPPPAPPEPAAVPTIYGELTSGDDVTMTLYDSNMNEVPLDDDSCTESGITGFFYWKSTNMTTFPSEAAIYFWVMDGSDGRRDYGTVEIGDRPAPELGTVWDKLTLDHTLAGSFGEKVNAVPTASENRQEMDSNSIQLGQIRINSDRVDGLIEDDGTGQDRFTAKALEEAPTTSTGDIETACGNALTTYDAATGADVSAVETKVDNVYTDTQRVDGLIEDDGSGNDRFTEKALEEAPVSSGSAIAEDIWKYVLTGAEGGGSAASCLMKTMRNGPVPLVKDNDIYYLSVDLEKDLKSVGIDTARPLRWGVRVRDRFGNDADEVLNKATLRGTVLELSFLEGDSNKSPYEVSLIAREVDVSEPWLVITLSVDLTKGIL